MYRACDSETFLITPTCLAPPLVCVSHAAPGEQPGIFTHDLALPILRDWFENQTLVLHNVAFDLAVFAAEFPVLTSPIWRSLAEGRVHDTMLREKLRDIALGEFRWRHLPDGSSERVNYALGDVAKRRLGHFMAKGEDTWRMRYRELHGVPLVQWPGDAIGYSVRDSTETWGVFEKQEIERQRIIEQTRGRALPIVTFGPVDWSGGLDILANEAWQVRHAWWMHLMACWGMPLDPKRVNALEDAVLEERGLLEQILIGEGLLRVERYMRDDPKKNRLAGDLKKITRDTKAAKALMEEVCTDLEIPVRMTKGGADGANPQVCLNAEACEDTGDEILQAYADYTALTNVLGKDIRAMRGGGPVTVDQEGQILCLPRIHARFDSLIASGRSACGGAMIEGTGKNVRGFNLQNLRVDGETRHCFVPPPGQAFCVIDLKAAELYAVAELCIRLFGFSRLAEYLNKGDDPHVALASTVTHKDYAEILTAVAADAPWAVRSRKVGKHSNYGFWGGMREKKFIKLVQKLTNHKRPERSTETGEVIEQGCIPGACHAKCGKIILTENEAHAYREGFLGLLPEAGMYLAMFEKICRGGRSSSLLQYRSNRLRGQIPYPELCNGGFQSCIADLMKEAGWYLSREMYDPECPGVPDHARGRNGEALLFGSRIVNFPHDEFICLIPLDALSHERAMRIREIVLGVGKQWLPNVPPTGDVYLASYWSKHAKPVYSCSRCGAKSGQERCKQCGISGRLVPWS